jgi:uncharacterized RDD family membrane protein YckC
MPDESRFRGWCGAEGLSGAAVAALTARDPSPAFCPRCSLVLIARDGFCSACRWPGGEPVAGPDVARQAVASVGARLAAAYADAALLTVSSVLAITPFVAAGDTAAGLGSILVLGAGWPAYLLWGYARGQSLGKQMMGIRIVREDGRSPGFGCALGRLLGAGMQLCTFGAGFASGLFDRRHQGWHDLIAGTVVVPVEPAR